MFAMECLLVSQVTSLLLWSVLPYSTSNAAHGWHNWFRQYQGNARSPPKDGQNVHNIQLFVLNCCCELPFSTDDLPWILPTVVVLLQSAWSNLNEQGGCAVVYAHEPFVSGSTCSLCLGCTLLGAMLGSTVGTCYASAPGFSTVFLVKVDSYPEVDSRPALLGSRSLEKCAQFRFWLLGLLHLENLDIISTSLAYLAVIARRFSFASEEFFPVSDTGRVAALPGVLTPGDPPPISLRHHSCGQTLLNTCLKQQQQQQQQQ